MGGAAGAMALIDPLSRLYEAELEEQSRRIKSLSPEAAATDEDFWGWVQQSYTVSPNIINLNNGGVSPQPKMVQDAMIRYYQYSNEAPSYYMWSVLDEGREQVRRDLARLAGCMPEEVAINRNSTEALDTIIMGIPLTAGDEVIISKQDYPNMINAWKYREKRDGVKLVWQNFNLPIENEEELISGYTSMFSEKTKVVHLIHIVNWMGQIMPVKKIIEAAHARGIEVVLDGAHSFAHFDYNLADLNPDYFGTSLHKWLCAPFGSGMLYVKKEKIAKLMPLFPGPDPTLDDIKKFEHLGTRSFPIEMAIGAAIRFHDVIGSERKEARLFYLKNYWAEKAAEIPGVKVHTSLKKGYSCAISLFSIEGMKPNEIREQLMKKYQIHSVAIEWENIKGVRITPNVYTTLTDLDKLVKAIRDMANTPK